MRLHWIPFVAAATLLPAAVALAATHPVSLLDGMRLNAVGGATISPNGHWVLFTVRGWSPEPEAAAGQKSLPKEQARSHVWLVSTAHSDSDGAARQLTFGDKGESSPAWSPDGKYITFIANRPTGDDTSEGQIYIMRADGGEAHALTHGKGGASDFAWAPDGHSIAFVRRVPLTEAEQAAQKRGDDAEVYEGDFQPTHVWSVSVATGAETELDAEASMAIKGALAFSPDSRDVVFEATPTPLVRDQRTNLYRIDVAAKKLTQITHGISAATSPAWSPDGKSIAYDFDPNPNPALGDGMPLLDSHLAHLMLLDVATGASRDLASPSFDLGAGAPIWSTDGSKIFFTTGEHVYESVFSYDLATGRYSQITHGELISLAAHGGFNRDGQRVAFTRQSATEPSDVYVAGADFAGPERLTTINPQTAEFELGATEVLHWTSSDGWPVEGVLVKPVGYVAGHRYPMLLEVHGGPTGAFSENFNLDAQFWAGKGWAVLYTNPRGSTNYGEKFQRGNLLDWGGGDYHDIMSGVDAVIARGIADPDKLAEWGWSYGGYMTCWIVSQTHRFKAAMMGAGLSDLASMYGSTDIPNYLGGFFNGYPQPSTLKLYHDRSGLTYVDNVTTPLLILQGAVDERVPISQSLEFYRALKERGKTVELVFFPREHHGFTEYYHELNRQQRIYDWISHYTVGNTPATPAAPQ
ncbi:MAG TPA: S9 family peptidase [Terriglobales bacterium]|jgi:dipeptidyl aminopeptidase/acylaminoacyl peptidase